MDYGEQGKFPILYADVVANPQVVYRWKGPLIMGSTAQYMGDKRTITPGYDFLEERILKQSIGDVQYCTPRVNFYYRIY